MSAVQSPTIFHAFIVVFGLLQIALGLAAPQHLHGYPGSVRVKQWAGVLGGTVVVAVGCVLLLT